MTRTEHKSSPAEIEHLQERVRRLAEEKSHLQLIVRLIEQLNLRPGVHDMVGSMLQSIVETIGGTNIKMWYWIEEELFYADFLGTRTTVATLEDPLARQVADERRFIEFNGDAADSLLRGEVIPGAWTWGFPLVVGNELVGIIKLENLHIIGASLRTYLPVFFSHAALMLSNEIRNHLHQRAQVALRLSASVFSNSQEGILITDANNRILDVNDAFTRISGYTRDEVLGKNPKLLCSGRQNAEFYAGMWRSIRETGSWRGEIWNRRKSGEIFAEMLSIDAVRNESGETQHHVGAFSDISQIKEHQAELERIAHYDTLTGLPNRRLLADRLNQELARTRRSKRNLGICYLDLDGFKPVNDQFGHGAGDQLLIEISERLLAVSRAGDTVARLGGDEFVILFSDLSHEQECFQVVERVLDCVARPFDCDGQTMSVSASIGVTLFPRDTADADTLMRHADQAMYKAKEAGKGRFHLFDAEHDRMIKANRSTVERLKLALTRDEFVLHYQPKVHMVRGEVLGAEALIRWQHPLRGMLAPAEFLPLLSGTEMEITLGEWVIDTALTQIEEWKKLGIKLGVSVNISARHLLRPQFMERLELALARHPGVSDGELELEILESTAIDDLSNAARTLAGCIALGVRFALDDFGTGYSSLTYFRKLPIGTLKIDQSFVRGMLDDPEDLGIIESVVGLAQAFNRPVIAEGVETIEHGAMLVRMGCNLGQGYGIARPMPADAIPAWTNSWGGEDIWRTLGQYQLPRDDMVLMVAVTSLRNWIDQLSAYVANSTSTSLPVMQPLQCAFGRWYHGSGISRYGHLGEFGKLDPIHEDIHALGEELVQLIESGAVDLAQARLTEIHALQARMLESADRLVAEVMNPP